MEEGRKREGVKGKEGRIEREKGKKGRREEVKEEGGRENGEGPREQKGLRKESGNEEMWEEKGEKREVYWWMGVK